MLLMTSMASDFTPVLDAFFGEMRKFATIFPADVKPLIEVGKVGKQIKLPAGTPRPGGKNLLRLGAGKPEGMSLANPFSGNKVKVADEPLPQASPEEAQAAALMRFNHFAHQLPIVGSMQGGHRRIPIPKTVLTETDLHSLGFVPVSIAVPETGQTAFRSFRHPNHNYHVHEHGDMWLMHEDAHPASTMLLKKMTMDPEALASIPKLGEDDRQRPRLHQMAAEFVRGTPHVITEGLPGLGYYLKGQLTGAEGMRERVLREMDPNWLSAVQALPPSLTYTAEPPPESGGLLPLKVGNVGVPLEHVIGGAGVLGLGALTAKSIHDQLKQPARQDTGLPHLARDVRSVLYPQPGQYPYG